MTTSSSSGSGASLEPVEIVGVTPPSTPSSPEGLEPANPTVGAAENPPLITPASVPASNTVVLPASTIITVKGHDLNNKQVNTEGYFLPAIHRIVEEMINVAERTEEWTADEIKALYDKLKAQI